MNNILVSSANETGETNVLPSSRQQMVGQISITGTQTVAIQGRINSDHDWVEIDSTSSSKLLLFTNPGEVRAVTSGTSGGSSITSVRY